MDNNIKNLLKEIECALTDDLCRECTRDMSSLRVKVELAIKQISDTKESK